MSEKKRLHREQCGCGWIGRWRNTVKRAAQDKHDHLQSCQGSVSA